MVAFFFLFINCLHIILTTMRQSNNKHYDTPGGLLGQPTNVSSHPKPPVSKEDETMKKYTSTKVEEIVISHLYYSMGTNRMVYYDYKTLIVPQLKEFFNETYRSFEFENEGGYLDGNFHKKTIDILIRVAKEKFQLFGHYNGDEVRSVFKNLSKVG